MAECKYIHFLLQYYWILKIGILKLVTHVQVSLHDVHAHQWQLLLHGNLCSGIILQTGGHESQILFFGELV
jgi:hypothetical protein